MILALLLSQLLSHSPSAHAYPQPYTACSVRIRPVAPPQMRNIDLMWLCGETNNSPVQGYGMREAYVSCMIYQLQNGGSDGNILTASCKKEADLTLDPRPTNCTEQVGNAAPYMRMIDRKWLCGETTNSPVPGYGMRNTYVSCLVEKIQRGVTDGQVLTDGCRKEVDLTLDPRPTNCTERVAYVAPYMRMIDRKWLCGETTNSPVLGYGMRNTYVSCLVDRLQRGDRDGNTLTARCREEADLILDPRSTNCTERVAYVAPYMRMIDRKWLCGETTNSPVPGYGNIPAYVDCITYLLQSGTTDGPYITSACSKDSHN